MRIRVREKGHTIDFIKILHIGTLRKFIVDVNISDITQNEHIHF